MRHRGIVVNAKKIRRLMHKHALNPKQRRRFIATTDSDHNYSIFPNLAKNMKLDGPNQLWVADITYVTIATGFVLVPLSLLRIGGGLALGLAQGERRRVGSTLPLALVPFGLRLLLLLVASHLTLGHDVSPGLNIFSGG